MRSLFEPIQSKIRLTNVLHALSDPIRLRIVRRLLEVDELSCKDFELPAAKSTLSHHFKTLRENGVTSTRVDGTLHFVSLRRTDMQDRFPGILEMIRDATDPL